MISKITQWFNKHIFKNNMNKENSDRTWHENFVNYTEMIVSHPNYKGLFFERKIENNRIKWVVTGKSEKGQLRQQWWDKKCKEKGVVIKKGCYAKVAATIHPTKQHICQICGKSMSIFYEYPNANFIKKLNKILNIELEHFDLTIREIIEQFCETGDDLKALNKLLGLECENKTDLINEVYDNLVIQYDRRFSPGVMSNPPDRYDGFHSDGACCREISDKGRHKKNMKTYTQDRRAYEHWADGDFNAANRLMGEFQKSENCICPVCGKIASMSADHIGPISLGFCHRPKFNAMCQSCNSSKNNRFTLADITQLISDEQQGEQVISWHSQDIWDLLKEQITTEAQARLLSDIMLTCHQNVLKVFSIIFYQTGREFLKRYLNPDYALYDVRFSNFNPLDLSLLQMTTTPLDSKNKESNKNRYLRISFESLRDFDLKDNRRTKFYTDFVIEEINNTIALIKNSDNVEADTQLKSTIQKLSQIVYEDMWENS
jgi:Type II restriction endonuclease (RE_Alw26IDE).